MSEKLTKATQFQYEQMNQMPKGEKPVFHVSAPAGWINDPNGFSVYKGKVHLFYQYHPYSICWGPMHWGHSVTDDMIKWKTEPVALAPDQEYDKKGCFSGSAVQAGDRHVLIYTGVTDEEKSDGSREERQNQCIAFGDGVTYEKSPQNPVITGDMLPQGCSQIDFRDPKIWEEDGKYYLIVGNKSEKYKGQVVLFSSSDLEKWKFETILAENTSGKIGCMWECPDFFELNGTHILICSPQNMTAEGLEFHNGHNSLYFPGKYEKQSHTFIKDEPRSLDYGLDFYAPQTTCLPDGRRIMIAWMKSWDSCVIPDGQSWQGMMTLPRELEYVNGILFQKPVRELEKYHKNPVYYKEAEIKDKTELPGIRGRILDMTVEIPEGDYEEFRIDLAHNESYTTSYTYYRKQGILETDRTYCGINKDVVCQRKMKIRGTEKALKLRFILDRQSIELFVNEGRQVSTTAICTPQEAERIVFSCDRSIKVNIQMYEIA